MSQTAHGLKIIKGLVRARPKTTSQNWRSDLGQIWSMRLSKTGGITSYFEGFANEHRAKPVLDPDRSRQQQIGVLR